MICMCFDLSSHAAAILSEDSRSDVLKQLQVRTLLPCRCKVETRNDIQHEMFFSNDLSTRSSTRRLE